MERIDKLTEIYLENLDPIKDQKVDQKTLKESLLNVLDRIKNRSGIKSKTSSVVRVNSSKRKRVDLWTSKTGSFSQANDQDEVQNSIEGKLTP